MVYSVFTPLGRGQTRIKKTFSLAVLIRILVATILVFIVTRHMLLKHIPDLEFDWILAFFTCLGVLVLILAMGCLASLVPTMIMMSSRGIVVNQGQSSRLYRFDDLVELRIDENKAFPMLIFRTREQAKPFEYAISPKVSLEELCAFIEKVKVGTRIKRS